MKRPLLVLAAFALLAGGVSGCASWFGREGTAADLDTSANDARVGEEKTRTNLGQIETAIADSVKGEGKIPDKLEDLVPKYLPDIPSVEVAACGADSNKIANYPSSALRDGQVDGSILRGTGRWGYVHNDARVVVFVDCLKPSRSGVPWYQVRGVY